MKSKYWHFLIYFFIISTSISCDTDDIIINDITIESITSDFRLSPNTSLPQGSEFFNVSVASNSKHGFLITWQNLYLIDEILHYRIYASRISKTGEMLDDSAIDVGMGSWPTYCPKAVYANGNWLIISNQGGMHEWVGVQRISTDGEVLDSLPIDVCKSIGYASLEWPSIATNGLDILCVTGAAGSGLYGSIFDSQLNIIEDRFPVYESSEGVLKISSNGENYFLTFIDGTAIKLIQISNHGKILSVQNVNSEDILERTYFSTIQVHDNISIVSFIEEQVLKSRRFSREGDPVENDPVAILELEDFHKILENESWWMDAFLDMITIDDCLYFFLPDSKSPGISMFSFKTDLSAAYEKVSLESQCQLQIGYGEYGYDNSYSFIRAASIENMVLTAWIDKREGSPRVYANLFEISESK